MHETTIGTMLHDYERGRLSRRQLIAHIGGLVAAAAAAPALAQGRAAEGSTFRATDVDHVALRVTDVDRSAKFYERLETQVKQVLREAAVNAPFGAMGNEATAAQLLLAVAEGRMQQFVRSGFRNSPLQGWESQWRMLQTALVDSANRRSE